MDERMGIEGRERERMLIKIMSFGRDVEGGKGYLYKDGQTVGGETNDDGFFFFFLFFPFFSEKRDMNGYVREEGCLRGYWEFALFARHHRGGWIANFSRLREEECTVLDKSRLC